LVYEKQTAIGCGREITLVGAWAYLERHAGVTYIEPRKQQLLYLLSILVSYTNIPVTF